MATQNVNIGINVSDNGTAKKVVKNFQEIETAATRAQRAAQGISAQPVKSTLAPGGTQGSRQAAQPTGMQQQMSNQQYGSARGTAGLTGASARDFAQQAQGLGGVVRLYATYAANVFAVGAAFRALAGAMDTANLVKGLDQMGAASGTALGTLSKRLVDVTDGAISMREAMEATAKAVSSGMSSENLLRMGKVAKQAAQALGVDMADAVSRLTRGITKLEPELLDELGIFTRVDMATQAYAKSVGKSTSAITDFEKRMAFANSVLEEGERKFSAIDFETNPYTKLLATLKDVAQIGLEVANTVIAPIIKFLSENPKALAVAIGALSIALVKQALPAIGQFKAGLESAAVRAAELSKTRSADAVKAQRQLASILQAEQAQFLDSQDQLLDTAAETLKKAGLGAGSMAAKLINTNMVGIDPEGVKQVEEQIKNVRIEAGKYARLVQENIKAGENPAVIEALRAKAEAYYDTAYAAETVLAGEVAAVEKNSRGIEENTMSKLNNNLAEKARVASIKQTIVANAAYNGSLVGISGAMKLANVDLKNSGLQLGFFRKNLLLARAGVAAFGGMVSRVMSSIGGFLNVIAMVGAGVAFLSSFLSSNAKEMSAFSGAADATDESLLNLGRTLDNINRKPFGQQFNTQSLMASATAINEITSSVGSLISKTLEADKASSGFDRFINSFKSMWGGDLRTQFAKSISGTVFGTLEKLGDSPEAKKARDSIASIIEVSPMSSREDWQSAFKAIADNEPKLRLVEQAMKDLGIATAVTAGKAEGFDNALKASEDAYKNFANQFKTSDPLAQLAESLIASGVRTAEAIEVPEMAIARLASVVGDVNKIALFDEQDQQNLLKYGDSITKTNQEFEKNKQAVKASKEEIVKLQAQLEKFRYSDVNTGLDLTDEEMSGNRAFAAAKKQLDARKEQLNKEQALVASTLVEITTLTARFPNLAAGQLIKGADMLSASISASLAKGSSAFAEAVLASVGDLPGIAKERERIEMRKLDSEARLIKIQTELARATILNSAELRRAGAVQAVEVAQARANLGVGSFRDPDADSRLKEAQKTLSELDKSIAVIKVDPSQALAALKTIQSEIKSGNTVIQQDAASLFEFINSLAGLSLQEQNNAAAKKVAAYKSIIDGVKEEFKQSAKVLANQREDNALLLANYTIQKARNGSLTEAESLSAQELQTQAIRLERDQKLLAVNEKLAVLNKAQSTGETAISDEVFQKEKQLLLNQGINIVLEAGNKITASELATIKDIYAEQQRLVAIETELVAIKKSGTDATQATLDKIRDLNHETQKSLGTFTPEYQAQQDTMLSITKVRLQAERDEQALTTAFIVRSLTLQKEAAQRLKEGQSPEKVESEVTRALNNEAEAYGKKVLAINDARDAEIDALTQTDIARKKSSNFDDMLNSLKILDSSWANFGTTLADTVKAFADLTTSQKQYTNTIVDLEKKRDAEKEGSEKRLELEDQISNTRKAAAKDEVSSLAKTAGATKKMFSEKTFAYKALEKIEKALHIFRIVSMAKEVAMDVYKTGVSVANSAIRIGKSVIEAGVDGVKAVVKAIASMPFPLNIAAGAATAAVIAGLLSQIGGKSPSVSGGAIENDGTGTVLGDKTAKSTAIQGTIEVLQDSDPVLMRNSTNMLKHLRSIDDNILAFGAALARSVGAGDVAERMEIQQGSRVTSGDVTRAFGLPLNKLPIIGGVFSSLAKGLGFGTKTSVRGQGLQLGAQTLGEASMGVDADFFADVRTKKSAFGITYDDKTRRRKLEFTDQDRDLQLALDRTFEGVFNSALAASETFGISQADMRARLTAYELKAQAISLKGTVEEQQQQLLAGIGKITDQVFLDLLPQATKFQKTGETYVTTVGRVVYGTEQARVLLDNLGINAIKFTDVLNKQGDVGAEIVRQSIVAAERGDQIIKKKMIFGLVTRTATLIGEQGNKFIVEVIKSMTGTAEEIAELYSALRSMQDTVIDFGGGAQFISEEAVRAAGGLDKLSDAIASFYDKFTSDDLKTAINNQKVTELFDSLNLVLPQTREEVLDLVTALTSTDPAAAAKIMAATDKLDEFYSSIENIANLRTGLLDQVLQLTGSSQDILLASRAKTLGETPEELRALQQYVFALEEVKSAEADLTKARQQEVNNLKQQRAATDSTVNSLKNYINSIKKFRESLLLGAASPLTPAERYLESKQQFDAILATAMGTAASPEEQRTKEAALGQLEGAASAFLDASRIYNASSAQYTNDFSLVQSALSSTENSLTSQLSIEERSLAALDSQISVMESQLSVSNNMLSVLQSIEALTAARAKVEETKSTAMSQTAVSTKKAVILDNTVYGAQGEISKQDVLAQNLKQWKSNAEQVGTWAEVNHLYDGLVNKWGLDSTQAASLLGMAKSDLLNFFGAYNLPAFAMGTNFVPEDMVAQIHQGERIIPAADNAELMANVSDRNRTNEVLVAEIRKLNQKIDSLEKTVANGAVINAEATNRNTVEITQTVKDTKLTASHSEALRRRTQVV